MQIFNYATLLVAATAISLENTSQLEQGTMTRDSVCAMVNGHMDNTSSCLLNNFMMTGQFGMYKQWNCLSECYDKCQAGGNNLSTCEDLAKEALAEECAFHLSMEWVDDCDDLDVDYVEEYTAHWED